MAQLTAAAGNGEWRRMENGEWGWHAIGHMKFWLMAPQPASECTMALSDYIDCRCHKNAKKTRESRAGLMQIKTCRTHISLFPLPCPPTSRLSLSKLVVRWSIYCLLLLLLFLLYFHSLLLRKVVVGNNNAKKLPVHFAFRCLAAQHLRQLPHLPHLPHLLQQPSWFLHISDSAGISLQWAGT